jgi:hypothetical protein
MSERRRYDRRGKTPTAPITVARRPVVDSDRDELSGPGVVTFQVTLNQATPVEQKAEMS